MRAFVLIFLAACGGAATAPDAGSVDASSPDAPAACPRAPRPDGPRKVVVSHPFGADDAAYQLLDLATDGTLTATATSFDLGKSTIGQMAFTPDGEIGLVAQEDGSLGVFAIDSAGTPSVIDAHFTGSFYATGVVMDPGGAVAYVLDQQWRENGGGIYKIAIGCDGTPTDLGLWLPSKLPGGIALRGDRLMVAATDVDGSLAGEDAYALDLNVDPPVRTAGVDAFGDDDQIVAGTTMTRDQQYFLIGDNNQFGNVPNRIAVVGIANDGDTLTAAPTLAVEDPITLVASPISDVVLAVSGFGNAVFAIDEAGGTFTVRGQVASPQLPGGAVGLGNGLVLVAENLGVRVLRFEANGNVTDLGLTSLGSDNAAITGSIGVQP